MVMTIAADAVLIHELQSLVETLGDPLSKAPLSERVAARLIPIREGFFLLRYVSAKDARRPPKVSVTLKPGADDDVQLLFGPGTERDLLVPGTAVAIAARSASTLMITTLSESLATSDDVEIKLDLLGEAPSSKPHVPALAFTKISDDVEDEDSVTAAAETPRFAIAGHVQGLGDTVSGPSGWLGAARARRWIEGFAITWERPLPGVKLSYAADVLDRGRTKMCVSGQYAGTRRLDLPVTGIVIEISGAQAQQHEVVVTAAFQSSGIQEQAGQRVEISTPSGDDPLVGLMLDVRPVQVKRRPVRAEAPPTAKSRVRIFRSQTARTM